MKSWYRNQKRRNVKIRTRSSSSPRNTHLQLSLNTMSNPKTCLYHPNQSHTSPSDVPILPPNKSMTTTRRLSVLTVVNEARYLIELSITLPQRNRSPPPFSRSDKAGEKKEERKKRGKGLRKHQEKSCGPYPLPSDLFMKVRPWAGCSRNFWGSFRPVTSNCRGPKTRRPRHL